MIESAAESQEEEDSTDDEGDIDDPPKMAQNDVGGGGSDVMQCPLADCLFETRSRSSLQGCSKGRAAGCVIGINRQESVFQKQCDRPELNSALYKVTQHRTAAPHS